MSTALENFIQNQPDWLRWMLVPFAVAAGFFVMFLLVDILWWISRIHLLITEDSWRYQAIQVVLKPISATGFAVISGVCGAPLYKFITSIIIGAAFIIFWGTGVVNAISELNYGMLISGLSGSVGASVAVFNVMLNKNAFMN